MLKSLKLLTYGIAMPDYPSNISYKQFEHIRPMLESAKKHTRPRTLNLYEVFCAVLHVLKNGCQWSGVLPNCMIHTDSFN